MRSIIKVFTGAVMLMFAGQALANSLAATHIIRNTVEVEYSDANDVSVTGGFPITASVDITVNLVAVAPDVTFESSLSGTFSAIGADQTVDLVYTLESNANGADRYDFSTGQTGTGSVDGITFSSAESPKTSTSVTLETGPDGIILGGSTAAAVVTDWSGTPTITVPADDDGTDDNENGFEANDTIVFNATGGTPGVVVCQVDSVTDSGSADPNTQANATATITVSNCTGDTATADLALGDLIAERVQLTVQVDGNAAGTLDFDLTLTSQTDGGATTTETQSLEVVGNNLRVFKFVKNDNTTNPTCAGSGGFDGATLACVTINGSTYYADSVTTDPGDTLDYAIVVINDGARANAIAITDPIVAFTAFATGTIELLTRTVDADPDSGTVEGGTGTDCIDQGNTCTITGTFETAVTGNGTASDYGQFTAGEVLASGGYDGSSPFDPVGDPTTGGRLENGEVSVLLFSVDVDGT